MGKNYELQVRKDLEESGIYRGRLNGQIQLTSLQLRLLDRMVDEFDNSESVDIEISASGTEKKVVNPLLPYIIKLMSQVQDSYQALGLNYNSKPENIKKEVKPEDPNENSVSDILNSFQDD